MRTEQAEAEFERTFANRATVVASAPGRVNLIGEHVDYCGGSVLPFAIPQRVVVAAAMDESGLVSAVSEALGRAAPIAADVSRPSAPSGWQNYVEGMVCELRPLGVHLKGARLWIGGDMHPGSGLSSSAALCMAVGYALAQLAGVDIPPRRMALAGQAAEHRFAGTPCGIMDQYASCFGREDHAMLIDCNRLEHRYVPFKVDDTCVLAIPSGIKHALSDGAYERRVQACRRALEAIRGTYPAVTSLREVDAAMLEACGPNLDEVTYRRARHVVTEVERVRLAVEALESGDLARLGGLIRSTQDSLRDDYEVSCPEIDALTLLLNDRPGVLGARMIGGGFGGVVIALVEEDQAGAIEEHLYGNYYGPRGLKERIFRVRPSGGASARVVA